MKKLIITLWALLIAANGMAWTPQYQLKRLDRREDINALNSNFNDLSTSVIDKKSTQSITGSKLFLGNNEYHGSNLFYGQAEFQKQVTFQSSIAASSATFVGDVAISGDINLDGGATFSGTTTFNGAVTFAGSVSGVLPAGTILTYVSTTAPQGYLFCDGASYSTASYPVLFSVIGYKFGGSGSTFRVPDFRGRFLRGIDNGAGRDPDRLSRTAMNTGGLSGDNIGSIEADAFQGHKHPPIDTLPTWKWGGTVGNIASGNGLGINPSGDANTGSPIDGGNGTPRTSSETRPINANVAYIIKY